MLGARTSQHWILARIPLQPLQVTAEQVLSTKPTTAAKIWGLLCTNERHGAITLLGLMSIGMVLETLGVGLVIPALAVLTKPDIASSYPWLRGPLQALGNPSQQDLVIGGMSVLVSVYLVKALFLAFLAWKKAGFCFLVQAQLSQRLFTTYLRQPYIFHLQRNSAQLLNNVTGEITVFTFNATLPCMVLATEALVIVGLCSLLLAVEPLGAFIVASVLGVAGWGFYRLTRARVAHWGRIRQHHEGLRIQHVQQGLGGTKDVKLLGREADFIEQYRVHNAQSARVGQFQATLQELPRLWLEFLAVLGLAMLVTTMIAQGRALDAVLPTLGLFAAAAFRLMPSVTRVLGAWQSLRYALPVIDRLHTELGLPAPEPVVTGAPSARLERTLAMHEVTYTYPEAAQPALESLSLAIQRGECVGFIGASGAGKSTLVDILLGLLTPDAGEVRVDGRDIQPALRNWQNQIGYVPQSIFLTDDTLRRNVAFGVAADDIDDAAVRRAIGAAQLDDFVTALPQGLDTIVGERGARLSGGQRQRIGIARALYHDPEVLVLDEATSALDTATERDVMMAVRALRGTKTIIIVAHRLSTVAECDRLCRLDHGRVVEEGSSASLLASAPAHSTV